MNRPTTGRPGPTVVPAADDDSELDPMDIMLGIVYAIAIPAGAYLLLFLAGMPPGGASLDSNADKMRKTDEIESIKQPPVTYREVQLRFARVEQLLQDRVPDFVKRAENSEHPHQKNDWQELAFRVLGICKNDLQTIQADIPTSDALKSRSELTSKIRRMLAHISDQEDKIIRNNPFPDRLREAQASAIAERQN